MTVEQLIKELKKMPKDAKVFTADHDHAAYEVNGPLFSVYLIEKSEADEDEELCCGFESMPDEWVTLSV